MLKVNIAFKDKTSISPPQPTKRKISNFIRGAVERNVVFEGSCRVTYSVDYYNEFVFSSRKDLEDKLWPCMEEDLVGEFA